MNVQCFQIYVIAVSHNNHYTFFLENIKLYISTNASVRTGDLGLHADKPHPFIILHSIISFLNLTVLHHNAFYGGTCLCLHNQEIRTFLKFCTSDLG